MTGARTRILYITGSGRSGTNFLGQLLGQADRFCFVGEAMYGGPSLATRRCGCGVPLPDCEFWRGIRRDAGGGRLLDEQRFFGLGRLARWRHLPLTVAPDRARRLAALYGQDWPGLRCHLRDDRRGDRRRGHRGRIEVGALRPHAEPRARAGRPRRAPGP
jgi:hypothetical protein